MTSQRSSEHFPIPSCIPRVLSHPKFRAMLLVTSFCLTVDIIIPAMSQSYKNSITKLTDIQPLL
jgi:hypothetical protein